MMVGWWFIDVTLLSWWDYLCILWNLLMILPSSAILYFLLTMIIVHHQSNVEEIHHECLWKWISLVIDDDTICWKFVTKEGDDTLSIVSTIRRISLPYVVDLIMMSGFPTEFAAEESTWFLLLRRVNSDGGCVNGSLIQLSRWNFGCYSSTFYYFTNAFYCLLSLKSH